MSGTVWVDVIHTVTGGRARINADALPAHKQLGWVIDPDPHAGDIDPTDPVATSTPEPEPFVDDVTPDVVEDITEPTTPTNDPRDATPATDTKRS